MNDIVYKSETYYKSIVGLDFNPVEITKRPPKFLKGQLVKKRSILGFKLSEEYAQEDLYEIVESGYDYCKRKLVNKERYARHHNLLITENGDFAYRAKVYIRIPNNSATHYFETDNEAISFLNELKEKCKRCKNELL